MIVWYLTKSENHVKVIFKIYSSTLWIVLVFDNTFSNKKTADFVGERGLLQIGRIPIYPAVPVDTEITVGAHNIGIAGTIAHQETNHICIHFRLL